MPAYYDSIRDVPDKYFWCLRGARGHDMELQPVGRRSTWGLPEDFRCTRCATERHDVIDALGDLSVRTYDHPRDYPGNRFGTGEVRLEAARRSRARSRSHLRAV